MSGEFENMQSEFQPDAQATLQVLFPGAGFAVILSRPFC